MFINNNKSPPLRGLKNGKDMTFFTPGSRDIGCGGIKEEQSIGAFANEHLAYAICVFAHIT